MANTFIDILRPDDIPFFPYRGGKARIRKYIIPYLLGIDNNKYIEPFTGRANVFFMYKSLTKNKEYILNDLYLHPFLNALKNFDDSMVINKDTLATKESFFNFYKRNKWAIVLEPILFWGGGTILTGQNIFYTGHRGHNLSLYKQKCLQSAVLLKNTSIHSIDAISLIREHVMDENVLLYLDPPYLNAYVGSYNENMFDINEMFDLLKKAKCKYVISEYQNKIYDDVFGKPKAYIYNIPIAASPKWKTVKRATEVLYSNIELKPVSMPDFFAPSTEYPIKEAISILHKMNSIFTFEEFINMCPKHWNDKTLNAQFKRICDLNYMYFNGKEVFNLKKYQHEL